MRCVEFGCVEKIAVMKLYYGMNFYMLSNVDVVDEVILPLRPAAFAFAKRFLANTRIVTEVVAPGST